MKFYVSLIVWLLMGAVLGFGIVKAVHGVYWPLVVAFVAFIVSFAKIGCLSH
jgi:hypothetical protein